jgi:formate dehydrogenase maturation protein FdhE
MKEKVEYMKCPICKYEWKYRGELMRATCSSCGSKVKVEKKWMEQND